jgi:acyl carrier protein
MTVDDDLTGAHDEQEALVETNARSTVDVAAVKAVVVSTLGLEARADTLDGATPLLGSVPELDSMAVLELVAALEGRFGIRFEDQDLTGDVFETIGSLAGFVDSKIR